jgi:lysophospholipase L1-like esterase
MPRTAVATVLILLALALFELRSPAHAQVPEPAQAPAVVLPPPLSARCEAPASDISSPARLAHLPGLLQSRKAIRVLAIGSSSTVGLGASSISQGYPAQLEAILERAIKGLDVIVINRGVSGEVAAKTAERLKLQVALEKPDLVLWQVGTNDALVRVSVEEFSASVLGTVRWLKEHAIDVVLVGLQYTPGVAKDEHYAAIRRSLRYLAAAENVLLVRRFDAMEFIEAAKAGPLLGPDDLHLNDLGYRCMAEHIARAMVIAAFARPTASPQP